MRRIILGLLAGLLLICSVSSRANELDLVPLVPDHVGLTMKKYPSLCWILINRPPVAATIMFSLVDSRYIKPILEVQLPSSILTEKNETCHCVNLKDYDIQLEPDIQYRWYISIAQNRESHSQDIVAGGVIERCSFEECLVILDIPSRCDMQAVNSFARSGFWYDTISCLCDLIKSNPDDKSLRRLLHSLVRQGGLQKLEEDYPLGSSRYE
jgi:uncharacterized protein DUF928